jgi:hypothetical protein
MTERTPNPMAAALASAFATRLRNVISPADWKEMQRLNATPEYGGGVCASHDFCDANDVMAAAFESIFGREPGGSWDVNPDGSAVDPEKERQALADSALWNAAWAIAAERHLVAPGAERHAVNPRVERLKSKLDARRAMAESIDRRACLDRVDFQEG